jgi:hypothetical protein
MPQPHVRRQIKIFEFMRNSLDSKLGKGDEEGEVNQISYRE